MSRDFHLSKTVLVVDDLDILRKMVRDFLQSLGITVLDASTAAEAIQIVSSHSGRIDLLLTDVEMSGMSGWESANRIARLKPGIRILYMSGGIGLQEWNEHKNKPLGTFFIQKPFRLEELEMVIRAILWEE